MNIKIYLDRYTETCNIAGTQFEQNATVIKFDFSELDFIDDECIKTIHFFHDSLEENNYIGDTIIENDEFKIPKSITKYEDVLAFIQITKEDFIWKTKSFNLDFYKSLDVDKTLDEDEIGILQELILEVKEIQNITTDKFEEVAEKATEDFNKNATEKLNDFNDNYTDKLNSFNENSNSKVNNYNSNAESKTEDFNANADNQKSNFDNNVTEKTNTFNSNTESKITEFNSNATSKETAYNENATAKLNEYNENHTIKMNAYNENSAEKLAEFNENAAEKITEYDNHIEDLDNIVSKKVVSGESIYIDDALEYKVFDCKIDGNAKQTTTTGKQMLQMCPEVHETNGITFTKNEDGSIIINGTATNTAFCNINGSYTDTELNRRFQLKKDSYYTLYLKNQVNGLYMGVRTSSVSGAILNTQNQELKAQQYTGEDDDTGLAFLNVATGTTLKNLVVYPMIAEGQFSELEWEEYTGGEPSPNPDYPQEISIVFDEIKIVQTGKNLFDKNGDFAYGNNNNLTSLQEDGTIKTTANFSNQRSSGQLISVDKNTNYIVSGILVESQSPNNSVIEILNENNTRIYMFEISNSANYKFSFMFNSADNEKIWISLNARDFNLSAGVYAIFDKIQIEEGSVATEYGEYKSNEYTINLQDNELVKLTDDIKDEITIDKNGNVSLSKRIGKVVLNGTENWIFNESGTNYIRFTLFINDLINNQENNKKYVASDYFVSSSIDEAVTDSADANRICAVSNQRLLIKLVNDNVMNLDDFKAWLSENNVTVYYELAEPTTTSLAQLTNFKTFEGINHFFLEANISTNFEVTYAQDLQKVISKQQAEINELKTLLSSTATSALLLDNYESDLINEIESEVEQ